MARTAVFIDGFNLYHSLDNEPKYHKYKWLNLDKLSRCFIVQADTIERISYFTSESNWDLKKLQRHRTYIKALKSAGVQIVYGAFRMRDRTCRKCQQTYQAYEEKRTDVNIAISLFETAMQDLWDTALVVSGDSDLIPAIEAIKRMFPLKRIGIVIPIGRRAEELKRAADFHIKVKEQHLSTSQFYQRIEIGHGVVIEKPITWI